ncbi:VOC family protein [Neobacillus drentensis]|uniref:VOC family protein n=1 Tax=Neobacillus drentensis TaxID=220684 RepID=UPI002FFF9467
MRLDHFVVHITKDDEKLAGLKDELAKIAIPFEPTKGKGTKGFKVANIWVGEQYLEMPWMLNKDGGGWRPEWVDKYHSGKRGIFGLCFMVDNVEEIKAELETRGVQVSGPERITFTMLRFFKKSLPFRTLYTTEIPGTDLQFMFLEMDSQEKYEFTKKYFMHPNSEKNQVHAINRAVVEIQESEEVKAFISSVFPDCVETETGSSLIMKDTTLEFHFKKEK